MEVLCVIPARRGSKRFPGKHQHPLLGRPLISYCIEAAKAARRITRVIVSSDDPEVLAIGEQLGVETRVRPDEHATDTASLDDALRHLVRTLEAEEGYRPEVVMLPQGNIPVRKEGQFDAVVERFEANPDATAVCTALETRIPPEWLKKLVDPVSGLVAPWVEGVTGFRKQDFPRRLFLDGAVAAVRTSTLMSTPPSAVPHAWLGPRLYVIEQDDPMYSLEVDNPDEAPLAAFFLLYRQLGPELVRRLEATGTA